MFSMQQTNKFGFNSYVQQHLQLLHIFETGSVLQIGPSLKIRHTDMLTLAKNKNYSGEKLKHCLLLPVERTVSERMMNAFQTVF